MAKVGVLTIWERDNLSGKTFADNCYYNPVQDLNGNWVISEEEINQTTDPNYAWVRSLPRIDFVSPIWNFPVGD